MSRSDPDLHRAISLRPTPWHHHPERVPEHHEEEPAQSTAYDYGKEDKNKDAVSRPVYSRNSSENEREDIENQSLPNYHDANDPYSLRDGLKSVDEIDTIRANTSKKRSKTAIPILAIWCGCRVLYTTCATFLKFDRHTYSACEHHLTVIWHSESPGLIIVIC